MAATHSIDIHFASLTVDQAGYRAYHACLDDREQAQAARFIRERDRQRYVVSHGKLRQLLAAYLGQAPKAIVFERGTCGKPFIIPSIGSLHFNLAHSGDFMIAAVSPAVEVGIDIEVLQDGRNVNELVEFVMADSERDYWQALPASAKEDFFYQLWTRKESFIKAVGLGLSLAPNLIETAVTGPYRFLSLPNGPWSRTDSTLVDLIVPAGVKGALTALTPVKIVPVMQEET